MKLFTNFLMTFIFIFLGIAFFNFIMPIIFEGLGSIDIEEIKIQLIMTLFVMIYTVMIIFAIKSTSTYFDLLSMFSIPRNEIMKSIHTTNIILTFSGSAIVNLLFLMVDIPQRLLILLLTTISLYLIMNFLNFIAFLGKIFGWYYVVGSFLLLASFIIAVVNYIGGMILMGLYIPHIASFLLISSCFLIVVNNFLSKKYEYKM